MIRIGAIGADSSHLPEFSRRINALAEGGFTAGGEDASDGAKAVPVRVTAFYDDPRHDMPEADVARWIATTREAGVRQVGSMDELLGAVDGVMVLAVSGHRHEELARAALARGLPTYIDKPLTCDLAGAKRILKLARGGEGHRGARCYSASSLRFAAEVQGLDFAAIGRPVAVDAYGPGELNPAMPGLFFYGVHTIEMVDAIFSRAAKVAGGAAGGESGGVARVRARSTADRDVAELEYRDGRLATLRLERKGCYDFGATVHGEKGVASFRVDFSDVYNRLVKGMVRFFAGGAAPVALRNIVENVAVMEAGNTSMGLGKGAVGKATANAGGWVEVEAIE